MFLATNIKELKGLLRQDSLNCFLLSTSMKFTSLADKILSQHVGFDEAVGRTWNLIAPAVGEANIRAQDVDKGYGVLRGMSDTGYKYDYATVKYLKQMFMISDSALPSLLFVDLDNNRYFNYPLGPEETWQDEIDAIVSIVVEYFARHPDSDPLVRASEILGEVEATLKARQGIQIARRKLNGLPAALLGLVSSAVTLYTVISS